MAFGEAESRQAVADVEHLPVEVRKVSPQAADSPILPRGWQKLTIVRPGHLAKDRPFAPPVHKDRGPVKLTVITAAASLAAATRNPPEAPFQKRLVVAEEAEDRGELHAKPVQLLTIGTRVVRRLSHGEPDTRVRRLSK